MKTRKTIVRIPIGLSLALLGADVLAQPAARHDVFAPVVDVEPIYVTEHVPVEREICWDEIHRPRPHGSSATGTIAGAILGGVIGNQFGGGSGKKALTVAGAALGASIGHDAGRRHGHARPVRYERCQIQVDYEERRVPDGYRVFYEYQGEILETRMQYPPGERIRLRVTAVPVG